MNKKTVCKVLKRRVPGDRHSLVKSHEVTQVIQSTRHFLWSFAFVEMGTEESNILGQLVEDLGVGDSWCWLVIGRNAL